MHHRKMSKCDLKGKVWYLEALDTSRMSIFIETMEQILEKLQI